MKRLNIINGIPVHMVRKTTFLGIVVMVLLVAVPSFTEAAREIEILGAVVGRNGEAVNINRYTLGYIRGGGIHVFMYELIFKSKSIEGAPSLAIVLRNLKTNETEVKFIRNRQQGVEGVYLPVKSASEYLLEIRAAEYSGFIVPAGSITYDGIIYISGK